MTHDARRFLRRAIELAAAGRAAGDAPFGSLLVGPNGTVLREDHNTVLSDGDVTPFFTRPISAFLCALIVLIVLSRFISWRPHANRAV